MSFLALNSLVLCLGFASSYTVFLLTGEWEFGGIAGLNPLKPVEPALYTKLNVHVSLTLTWALLATYQLYTAGAKSSFHVWAGRLAIPCACVMWTMAPASGQISSCYPVQVGNISVSSDIIAVSGIIALMILNLVLGWFAIREGQVVAHRQYMCHAMWAAASPALMRIVLFPLVAAFSAWNHYLSGNVDKLTTWLSVGQWLLVKEITYGILLTLSAIPYFFPQWSPYAKYAYKDFKSPLKTVICNLFLLLLAWDLVFKAYKLFQYITTIGVAGGTDCAIQESVEFGNLIPQLVKHYFV